jgi:hypothetical protein
MSRSSGLGFGGVLLGVGIGWVVLNYVDVSFDTIAYLLIIVGSGIVASSLFFRGRNRVYGEIVGGIIGGLFLAAIFSGIFGFTNIIPFGRPVTGSGDMVTQTFDYQGFTAIDAGYGFDIKITQGSQYSITVSVDDNVEDKLRVRKDGDTLRISLEQGSYSNLNLEAKITMPSLNSLEFSGGTRGTVSGFKSTNDFNIELSGGSYVNIVGLAGDLTLDASGGSHFDLSDFTVNDVDANLSGGSNGSVYVGGTLNADASGGSHLTYYGDPKLGNIDESSGSTITPK